MQFKNRNMFYLLKKNYLLQIFALVAVLVLCGVQIFFNSLETTYLDSCLPCAAALASAAVSHPLLLKISLFLSLLLQMWLLFRYVSVSGFLEEESILPSSLLFALLLAMGIFQPLSSASITNLAILLVLNLNGDFQGKSAPTTTLISGIIIGLNSLFDIAAALLLLFYVIMLFVNRLEKIKSVLTAICGVILVYIYLFSAHFFRGTLIELWNSFSHLHCSFPIFTQTYFSVYAFIAIALFALFSFYVMVRLKVQYDSKLILLRQRFLFLCVLFVFGILMLLTSNLPFPFSLTYLLIPATCYIVAFIPSRGFSIPAELLLCILSASLIVMARL